jgi:hypothetical protein
LTFKMAESLQPSPSLNKAKKIIKICKLIQELNMTPKSYLIAFLQSPNSDIAYQQWFWVTQTGWNFTLELLKLICSVATCTGNGAAEWNTFIEREV